MNEYFFFDFIIGATIAKTSGQLIIECPLLARAQSQVVLALKSA
jgi:hypothetical protein